MDELQIEDIRNKLLRKWINNLIYLEHEDKEELISFGERLTKEKISSLYKIFNAINENQNEYTSHNFGFVTDKDKYYLILRERKIKLELNQVKEIVAGFADMIDDILPLGSVVELNKDYIRKVTGNKELEKAQIVIVNRFIFKNEVKAYFPYAGIVYPYGFLGNDNAIHFTSSLIDKVIHVGFQDDKDKAYTLAVKNELIVAKKMHSFGFATEAELGAYKNIMKGRSESGSVQSR